MGLVAPTYLLALIFRLFLFNRLTLFFLHLALMLSDQSDEYKIAVSLQDISVLRT